LFVLQITHPDLHAAAEDDEESDAIVSQAGDEQGLQHDYFADFRLGTFLVWDRFFQDFRGKRNQL